MNNPFDIKINGKTVRASQNETILTVARRLDLKIPTLCHDDRLAPAGACRTCLVEVEGQRRMVPACACMVTENMDVTTDS